ncbi:MAG: hypothetical protein NTX03_08555 [Bacteroidetes bacterium]|nr:hypothetical protein [Bacteroidota bacterium]
MDKIKDIFKNINDRISNPLIFSFLCSWLVINWQIVVSLIWYDPAQIEKTGRSSIFNFIIDKTDSCDNLWYPLLCAVIYTGLMPIVKIGINAFYAKCATFGDNWVLGITGEANVPFERYIKLRNQYDKRSAILEETIAKESNMANKFEQESTKLLESQAMANGLRQQLTESNNFINQLFNVSILNGYWTNTYSDTYNKDFNGAEDVFLENGNYYILEKFGERKLTFSISKFYYDSRNKTIVFIKERINQNNSVELDTLSRPVLKFNINVLIVQGEDLLVGFENGTVRIEYRRKSTEVRNVINNDEGKELW